MNGSEIYVGGQFIGPTPYIIKFDRFGNVVPMAGSPWSSLIVYSFAMSGSYLYAGSFMKKKKKTDENKQTNINS